MTASEPRTSRPSVAQRVRVRWNIFLFLFAFALIAYLQHTSIAVAGVPIMAQQGLSEGQLAWILDAFVIGYTLMQFPGGLLGQRFGARRVMTVIGVIAVIAMLVVPLAPALLSGAALFAALFGAQLLLGLAQGPIFPITTGVFEAWFRPGRWPLVQGISRWATRSARLSRRR